MKDLKEHKFLMSLFTNAGLLVSCLAFTASSTNSAHSQELLSFGDLSNADKFDLNLATPTATGLVAIGASAKDAANPGNMNDFAIDVASIVANGKVNPGVAITVAPYWWEDSFNTLQDYRSADYSERLFARTQFSLGTASTDPKNKSAGVLLGFGFHTQLLDSGDQKFDRESEKCLQHAWDQHLSPQLDAIEAQTTIDQQQILKKLVADGKTGREAFPEAQRQARENYSKRLKKLKESEFAAARKNCADEAADRFLQAASWTVGGGVAALSSSGDFDDIDFAGASFWSTFRLPFTSNGKGAIKAFVQGDLDKEFDLKTGGKAEANAILAAVSAEYQDKDLKLDATVSYTFKDFDNPALGTDDFIRFSGSAEYRLREGLWLVASGGAVSNAKFEEEGFGTLGLKVDLAD